ncbi:hypothetical protein [Spiroplasma phoeniceum]|nr:hypothetical protein [Spiroplasma phoeniceum]
MKIDENICIAPHCEEIRLLVMPVFSMCGTTQIRKRTKGKTKNESR